MIKKLPCSSFAKKAFILSSLYCSLSSIAQAQTVTIYRTGTIVIPSYTKVSDAISAAIAGDSLVLSPHTFKENSLSINKNLKLTGTSDINGKSTIDAEFKGRALFISNGNVGIIDLALTNGKIMDNAGGCIANYGTGELNITGNSSISNSSCSGIFANGGGIYSAGKLVITGNTEIKNNSSTEEGGGVYAYTTFVLGGNAKISNNTANGSGGGVFSRANGGATLSGNSSINNNTALVAGGGMFGVGTLKNKANISGNKAEYGGGIAGFNDIIFLYDTATIANNTATSAGGGIWLNNCSLYGYNSFHIVENKIPASSSTTNFGGAIYNVNGSILVTGGVIKGNQSPVAAVYNTASSAATNVKFNSTHFFNPKADGTRQAEIFNSPSLPFSLINFTSDYCWWGSNDTTNMIGNRVGTNSGIITSFVKSTWLLNLGNPINPYASTFPLSVDFRLNDGSKMDSLTLRHIQASFTATNGSFNPSHGWIDTLNYIRSTFTVPNNTDSIKIMAWVDADTFRTGKIGVIGLEIKNATVSNIKLYPNPANELIYIANAAIGSSVQLFDIQGRLLIQSTITEPIESIYLSKLAVGNYIIQITEPKGQKISAQINKQ